METMKPTRVEVGQRWRFGPFDPEDGTKFTYTIVAPYPELPAGYVHVEYDDGSTGIIAPKEILRDSEYLGPPPPSVEGVRVPAKGQRYATKYHPFTVVRYVSETDWAVRWDDKTLIGNPEDSHGLEGDTFAEYCEEFEARLIDEGPRPTPIPSAPAEIWQHSNDGETWIDCQSTSDVCSHRYTRRKGQTVASVGVLPQTAAAAERTEAGGYAHVGNLTALQLIQARKKPELWRPGVDDYDLLPDAGR